jgi:hypothetical protein
LLSFIAASAALAFIKAVTKVLSLDSSLVNEVAALKRTLLTQVQLHISVVRTRV